MHIFLNYLGQLMVLTVIIIPWLMGIVLAQGFWQTLCAFFPPYAWYLVVEYFMKLNGMI